jgi:two-component system, NarL family, nitrate/nitrite response regulator NarL
VTTKLAIVEDHGLIAHTLAAALSGRGVDMPVVNPRHTDDMIGAVRSIDPDVVLLDLDLGEGWDSISLIGPFMETGAAVVIVTGVEDPVWRAQAIRAGAVGIIDKGTSFEEFVEAVDRVLKHGKLIPSQEREEHLALLRDHESERRRQLAPFERLTGREAEVLGDLMRGWTVEEIAANSVVSVSTVRTQVRAILTKLEVSSQVAAIGKALTAGWEPPQKRS